MLMVHNFFIFKLWLQRVQNWRSLLERRWKTFKSLSSAHRDLTLYGSMKNIESQEMDHSLLYIAVLPVCAKVGGLFFYHRRGSLFSRMLPMTVEDRSVCSTDACMCHSTAAHHKYDFFFLRSMCRYILVENILLHCFLYLHLCWSQLSFKLFIFYSFGSKKQIKIFFKVSLCS